MLLEVLEMTNELKAIAKTEAKMAVLRENLFLDLRRISFMFYIMVEYKTQININF
jgi:hypothetical protein